MLSTRFSAAGHNQQTLTSLAEKASVIGCEVDKSKLDSNEYSEGFLEAVGEAVTGYVATNLEEIELLRKEGKKAILFVENYLPETTPYLQKIAGLVIQGKFSVSLHLRTLVSNYSISALRDNLTNIENRREIKFGDAVTIDCKSDKLYFRHIDLKDNFTESMREEEEIIDKEISEYVENNAEFVSVPKLKFKTNLDYVGKDIGYDIGLMRTEHMVLANKIQMDAFKNILLTDDNLSDNCKIFAECLEADLEKVILRNPNRKIRVRLLDLPANELFSDQDDLRKIRMMYGYKRGVQMAQRRPEIYQSQAYAVLTQIQKHPEAKGIEILIPTVRDAKELQFAKDIVDDMAEKLGVNTSSYKFGSMIETLGACDDIENIVPLCDFVNFGCNDLTSEMFNCSRCDGAAIKELCDSHGGINPFFVMHGDVQTKITEIGNKIKKIKPETEMCACGDNIMMDYHLYNLQYYSLIDSVSFPPNHKTIYKTRMEYNSYLLNNIEERKADIEQNPEAADFYRRAKLIPESKD